MLKNNSTSQTIKAQIGKLLSICYCRAECCLVCISEIILGRNLGAEEQEIFSDLY